MKKWVAVSLISALLAMGAAVTSIAVANKNQRMITTITSVMLQAMERGYQCRADGRSLEDCQNEQRKRWDQAQ